jgi:hypothetical protein
LVRGRKERRELDEHQGDARHADAQRWVVAMKALGDHGKRHASLETVVVMACHRVTRHPTTRIAAEMEQTRPAL